ncbi:MAG: hypothetical protein ACI4RJ_01305 [Alphaproteobacteria bacterium]
MQESLEKLTKAIQQLEEAVALAKEKNNADKEKIKTLQGVIQTSYHRINQAIEDVKKKEEETNQEELCLSLS